MALTAAEQAQIDRIELRLAYCQTVLAGMLTTMPADFDEKVTAELAVIQQKLNLHTAAHADTAAKLIAIDERVS